MHRTPPEGGAAAQIAIGKRRPRQFQNSNFQRPLEYLEGARPEGPLASFVCPYDAVDHPHRPGVVLIGDAAAETDPSFGQGLSLTLRDVRVLRDKLLGTDDWEAAAEAYAAEHNRYVEVSRNVQRWMSDMLLRTGAEADARRAKALPLWEQDPTRPTDVLFSGPDIEIDETVRQRFYGEDQSRSRGSPT